MTVKASTVVACSVAFRTVDSLRAELAVADETINRLRRLRTDLDANFEATLKAKDAEIAELRKALIEIVKNSSRRSKICLIC